MPLIKSDTEKQNHNNNNLNQPSDNMIMKKGENENFMQANFDSSVTSQDFLMLSGKDVEKNRDDNKGN